MASSIIIASFSAIPNSYSLIRAKIISSFRIAYHPVALPPHSLRRFASVQGSLSLSNASSSHSEEEDGLVQDLRVPEQWLDPSKALEESEWLRLTLHKWLDDEYCPESTNVDISNTAARSYYKSLVEKQTDLGEILLKMARELESISYQESFHGAFSSANAAINLIIQRIEQI